jgi:hypothetical protein
VLALAPDADVLLELADALVVEASHGLPEPQRAALGAWLLDTARGAFFLPADDVPFHAGRVLHRLGFAHAAVACFSTSLERHGDLVVTRLHRALSLAALDARAHALADLHEVLRREPTHPEALRLVAQLA